MMTSRQRQILTAIGALPDKRDGICILMLRLETGLALKHIRDDIQSLRWRGLVQMERLRLSDSAADLLGLPRIAAVVPKTLPRGAAAQGGLRVATGGGGHSDPLPPSPVQAFTPQAPLIDLSQAPSQMEQTARRWSQTREDGHV